MAAVPRFLSILLVVLFGLPLVTPLLALTGAQMESDGNLPACCRRLGAHHCSMSAAERQALASPTRQFAPPPERCPFRNTALAAPGQNPHAPALPVSGLFSAVVTHPAGAAQAESRRRIARERTRHKRGPPALSLL